jgi:hypothetical protein
MALTQQQIETLREGYARFETMDPEGRTYNKLCAYLDGLSKETLIELEQANIKWISMLCRNRLDRRIYENERVEI